MKKIIIILILCYTSQMLSAQTTPSADTLLLKKIAREACHCLDGKDLNSITGGFNLLGGTEITDCFEKVLFNHRKEIGMYAEVKDEDFDKEMGKKLGNKIGIRMIPYLMRDCNNFFNFLVNQLERTAQELEKFNDSIVLDNNYEYPADTTAWNDSTDYTYEETNPESYEYSITGTLKSLETPNYTYLTLVDEKGISHRFLWLHYFENADALSRNFKKFKNKKVRIEWYESEIYDPKEKLYVKHKEISWLEFLDN